MIYISQRYVTSLKPVDVNNFITGLRNEKIWLLHIRKFKTHVSETGFRIQERRTGKNQPFYPLIIGKYPQHLSVKYLDIRIIPSIFGTLFFAAFWIAFPLVIWTSKVTTIDTILKSSEIISRIEQTGILILLLAPVTIIFLWLPCFKAQKWIENELKLQKSK